ncbi:penicillin-binding protein [Candidatus Woesebacteria bacterium]|nr:penicillin-binding protein [Candidatus Woesebacteria bacterium]
MRKIINFFGSFWGKLKSNRVFRKKIFFWTVFISFSTWLFWGVPLPTQLSSSEKFPVSTKLFDRNGKLIYEIFADKRRTPIKLEELPEYVKTATIAIEDKDFYKHYGFSPTGIARAVYKIVAERKLQGGSTLTQQLVKNALLTPERTVRRKLREFFLTVFVEGIYSKETLLEMYLNQIPYGGTAYGIEAAAELYFEKSAKDLTLGEAALLTGLPQAPSRYSPFGAFPENAKARQETVLRRMVEDKVISQEEADKAKEEELVFAKQEAPSAPHFALWIKAQLSEKYGEKVVEQGGLRVKTTLDLDLQEFAQNAVATEVGKLTKQKVGNGAAIITRPKTGEILAMVGSKDYFAEDEDGKVNVILAKRQPGSSIKPLNYALALRDEKITAATALADVPTCFSVAGQPLYCPVNYDGTFHGLTQPRFTLGSSYNIPAVRVLALNGVDNFVDFAKSMGLTTLTDPSNYGLSLTLGGGEVRPYDMAEAFGVFANEGIKQSLVAITKVEDWKGHVLEEVNLAEVELSGERVLTPDVTFLVSHILLDNNARSAAFGETSFLNVAGHPEVSVKTGTTNDRRDNWTVGYSAHAVVVTWVGNNNNTPMSGAVSGVSGASPIWNRLMREVLNKAEDSFYNPEDEGHAWPHQPGGVVGGIICSTTGLKPSGDETNPGCPTRFEYFLEGTVPSKTDGERADIQIDKTTGQVARADTPPEQIETQNHPVYYDPLGTLYCLDCPIASSSATIRYPLTH